MKFQIDNIFYQRANKWFYLLFKWIFIILLAVQKAKNAHYATQVKYWGPVGHLFQIKKRHYLKDSYYLYFLVIFLLFLCFRFDPKKGFYCQTMSNNKSKCLGRSKGRKYPPMDQKSMAVLQQFYSKHNVALSHLLEKYKYRIPNWLEQELSSSR